MGSSGSVQAMERNVARLFSERGPIFGGGRVHPEQYPCWCAAQQMLQATLGQLRIGASSLSYVRVLQTQKFVISS